MIHHGNKFFKKGLTYFFPVDLEICMRTYSEYEHIFRREKRRKVERTGVGGNCCSSKCLNVVYSFKM